ncbi:MAG: hypothetical protein ABF631_00075 [Liquorilactobacillus nagelii]|uniref:hypothetical protein n=1 Tax=Liquorilactobacillus nagelii TaxID=82688 RepID=UPI0039EA1391
MLKILNRNKEICFPTMNGTIQIDIQQMIMPETSQLIITHLNSDILQELLQIDNKKLTVFVSYELYYLLQKLQHVQLLRPINSFDQFKIMPTGFPQQFGELTLTAFNNDDSLTGSIALLIKNGEETTGYCAAFAIAGFHLKRIHRWQKAFRQAEITQFTTNRFMLQSESTGACNGEVRMMNNWESCLIRTPEFFGLRLCPWNPERIYRFLSLAATHQRKVFLTPIYYDLIKQFTPFGKIDVACQTKAIIKEAEQSNSIWQVIDEPTLKSINKTRFDSAYSYNCYGLAAIIQYLDKDQVEKLRQQLGNPKIAII